MRSRWCNTLTYDITDQPSIYSRRHKSFLSICLLLLLLHLLLRFPNFLNFLNFDAPLAPTVCSITEVFSFIQAAGHYVPLLEGLRFPPCRPQEQSL